VTAEVARLGSVLGCSGLALLFVGRGRWPRFAGLVAWALGALLLAAYLAPHGHRAILAAAGLAGLVLVVVGAWLLLRWPWLVVFAGLACVPARIPVTVAHSSANLLVPLYGVVAAAALAFAWELLRGDSRVRELGRLAWPLAGFTAWTGLSLVWSKDVRQGAIEICFFYLPFGLLALVVARLPWNRRSLALAYTELVAMAIVFAAVGVYQYATRDVFWNPKVIVGNAYAPFFRVNSVFWDPSIYGRFLAVAIAVSLVLVLQGASRRIAVAATAAIAAIWIGLLFSFSQSSFAALIGATLVLAAIVWRSRAVLPIVLVGAVLLLVGVSAPQVRHTFLHRSGAGLNHASSGRLSLVENGGRIALAHAGVGVGVGGFKRAYAERTHLKGTDPKAAASHDTPITVAAETGIVGLGLFCWLVVAALLMTLRRPTRSFRGLVTLAVGIALAVIAVHSLFYNALFEDPMAWALLGLAALAANPETERVEEIRGALQDSTA
jgi:hypothetical protein